MHRAGALALLLSWQRSSRREPHTALVDCVHGYHRVLCCLRRRRSGTASPYIRLAHRSGRGPRPSSIAQPHHVPEAGGRSGDGLPDERRRRHGRTRPERVLPCSGSGRGDGGLRDAGAGAAGGVVDGAVRLLRRLQQLLRDVPVPVRDLRADRGDHRPRVDVVRGERRALRAHHVPHGLPVRLLLLLPRQDARPLRPAGEPLRRLLHPLVLRAMRALPGVPRAQEERLRHEPRMARQHGEARAHSGNHATPHAPRDDPLIHRSVRAGLFFLQHTSKCASLSKKSKRASLCNLCKKMLVYYEMEGAD